jgi:hypothetical protein
VMEQFRRLTKYPSHPVDAPTSQCKLSQLKLQNNVNARSSSKTRQPLNLAIG